MTARKRTIDIINKALHSSNIEFLPRRVLNFDIPEPDQVRIKYFNFPVLIGFNFKTKSGKLYY